MNNTTNAAKRPSGLRACADGFNANPDKEFALKCMRYAADRMEELETELTAVTEQRDKYRDIASELIAMIRINVMRDTFKIATIEQVDEHLKPWIARIAAVKGGGDE